MGRGRKDNDSEGQMMGEEGIRGVRREGHGDEGEEGKDEEGNITE